IRAADSVIVTISGKSGLTTGGKKAYRMAKKQGKARMIYVGKLDRESSDFYKVLEQLKTEFGPSICPLVVPFVEDHKVQCYIDLVDMKAFRYENGKAIEVEMPQSEHRIDGLITAISEAVAETDDDLFEKYFSGEKFTQDELLRGIRKGVRLGDITPVFCGSSTELDGIDVVLKGIQMLLPNALEAAIETAFDAEGNEVGVSCDEDKDLVAYVFKTVADPFVGKLSFVKVISGKLSPESAPKNSETGEVEKMGKLLFLHGKKQEDTKLIPAGDIGAVTKLSANTGDTLYEGAQVTLQKADFPQPCYSMAVLPVNKGDESKISQGIKRLLEEDLTLGYSHNHETHQRIISGLGEQHLDVVVSKLKSKFGVDVTLEPPMVAYRET
ncbi:MAG: elongation factor G, partial [Clostridiales bacterium]|nr:elongation factor G [Clostridiales bacterium]